MKESLILSVAASVFASVTTSIAPLVTESVAAPVFVPVPTSANTNCVVAGTFVTPLSYHLLKYKNC